MPSILIFFRPTYPSYRTLRRKIEGILNAHRVEKRRFFIRAGLIFAGAGLLTILLLKDSFPSKKPFRLFFLKQFEVDLLHPVISTPCLLSGRELVVASRGGNVYWMNLDNGRILCEYVANAPIVAPLALCEVDGDRGLETILAKEREGYTVVNHQGVYLYKSREDSIVKGTFAKPVSFQHHRRTFFIICGREGGIEAVDSRYGEIKWSFDMKFEEEDRIVASPVLVRFEKDIIGVVVSSREGEMVCLNALNGQVWWRRNLTNGWIGTPVPGRFLKKKRLYLAAVSIEGTASLIDLSTGETASQIELYDQFSSSPVAGPIRDKGFDQLITASHSGKVYLVDFSRQQAEVVVSMGADHPFRASPILSDLDGDHYLDAIVASGSGGLMGIDLRRKQLMGEIFQLPTEITATPLLVAGDVSAFLVISGENGKLYSLKLQKRWKSLLLSHSYSQFLGRSDNQNRIRVP